MLLAEQTKNEWVLIMNGCSMHRQVELKLIDQQS